MTDLIPRGVLGVPAGVPKEDGFPALTTAEKETFETLKLGFADGNLALMRVRHGGRARAVLAVTVKEKNGMVGVYPLAIMLDDDLFEEVAPPPEDYGSDPVNS